MTWSHNPLVTQAVNSQICTSFMSHLNRQQQSWNDSCINRLVCQATVALHHLFDDMFEISSRASIGAPLFGACLNKSPSEDNIIAICSLKDKCLTVTIRCFFQDCELQHYVWCAKLVCKIDLRNQNLEADT